MKLFDWDTPATIFWRVMCDRASVRIREVALALPHSTAGVVQLRGALLLDTYCRRRYWQAFDTAQRLQQETSA